MERKLYWSITERYVELIKCVSDIKQCQSGDYCLYLCKYMLDQFSYVGVITVELLRHGEVYTWENVNCSVHNIIVGKLWVEHHGRMEIINHKTGHRADITFKKSNMFSRDVHRLEGAILDNK